MTSASPDQVVAADGAVRFRIGGRADIPAVARLARQSFDPHYREVWNEAQMTAALVGEGGFLLVHAGIDPPPAFALCRQVLEDVELLLCATHPARRRQGLGRQTIAAVAAEARRRRASRLFLEVRASNSEARALYAACGLEPLGIRRGYYRTMTGEAVDAISLSMTLSA